MKMIAFIPLLWMMLAIAHPPALSNETTVTGKPVCPVCKSSKNVVPIIYGKPCTELIKKAERGECKLGGCTPDENSPRNYCKKDKIQF